VRSITLELPPGTVTALVGESGAGKSTLAGLLLGLTPPQEGRVTVNGVDLAILQQSSWRQRIAWVPQRPFFFPGSVRENLTLGREEADGEVIVAALEAAGARSFVERMPHGLDTPLGDRGAGLSGGELRRLALARVFLRDPSLVILDEPTAGLDAENERLVSASLRRLAEGRTLLLISHREQTVEGADRVAILAGGELVQLFGRDEALVAGVSHG
jgi:ATP-binding cassette subfamily C protein CydD